VILAACLRLERVFPATLALLATSSVPGLPPLHLAAAPAFHLCLLAGAAGHPESVTALLRYDEDSILTGSSDGLIRVLSIQPNKMLGVLGEHSGGLGCTPAAQRSCLPAGSGIISWHHQLSAGVAVVPCKAFCLARVPAALTFQIHAPSSLLLWATGEACV
jgi:hypothetical protein